MNRNPIGTVIRFLGFTLGIASLAYSQTAPAEVVLHNFAPYAEGANPYATLIRDDAGNLIGTTYDGGAADFGAVYKIDPSERIASALPSRSSPPLLNDCRNFP